MEDVFLVESTETKEKNQYSRAKFFMTSEVDLKKETGNVCFSTIEKIEKQSLKTPFSSLG